MEIQNVTIEDAEELLDIYAPYVKYTAITFEYDVPSVEEFRQRIVNISNRYPYIKAVDGRFHDSGYKFNQWFDMVWMEKMIGEHNAEPKEVWG